MKKLKRLFKRILKRFRNATTPAKWKKYRNLAATMAGSIGAGWAGAVGLGVTLPEGWGKGVAATIGILLAFASFAQAQENKPDDKQPSK